MPREKDGRKAEEVARNAVWNAESYTRFFDPACRSGRARVFQNRLALVRELLKEERGPLLDVACGTGEVTEAALRATKAQQALVNDLSENMLRVCRARLGQRSLGAHIDFTRSDVFDLLRDLPSGSFGTVLCSGLLAHVGRLPELVEGLARACRPNGVVLLQSSLMDHLGIRAVCFVARCWPARFPRHFYFWRSEILQEASAKGLRLEIERRYGLCLPFGDRLLGPLNRVLEDCFGSRDRFGGEALFKFRKACSH